MVMVAAIFEEIDGGRPRVARARAVQALKALRQVALDNGAWKNAWPLTGLVEPGKTRKFGGSERELEIVASYNRALDELEKRTEKDRANEETGDKERK